MSMSDDYDWGMEEDWKESLDDELYEDLIKALGYLKVCIGKPRPTGLLRGGIQDLLTKYEDLV